MNFELSHEQQLIIESARMFVEQELYPYEAQVEKTNQVSPQLVKQITQRSIEQGFYAAIKETVRVAENHNFQDTLDMANNRQLKTVDRLYSSEDQLEGAQAFAQKRKPAWKGY